MMAIKGVVLGEIEDGLEVHIETYDDNETLEVYVDINECTSVPNGICYISVEDNELVLRYKK